MGLLDSLPITHNQIILYSAIGYTLGVFAKQKQLQQLSGYGIMAGAAWWGIKTVQEMLGVDIL